jgi:hypothetical protein
VTLPWRLRPPAFHGVVGGQRWVRLRALAAEGRYRAEFAAAWANGACFLAARDGSAGRRPEVVEWKGPQAPRRAPSRLPADLRIDHVYLVSCKYKLPHHAQRVAPLDLRSRRATAGAAATGSREVAPEAAQALYDSVRASRPASWAPCPTRAASMSPPQRRRLASALGRGAWPSSAAAEAYTALSAAVARPPPGAGASACAARGPAGRAHTLWRFLRVAAATYFVLGSTGTRLVRVRVGSPWDWRQSFRLRPFEVAPAVVARQPLGQLAGQVEDRATGEPRTVAGHVEIRWSHGRFAGPPEAKVHLDTPHHQVPATGRSREVEPSMSRAEHDVGRPPLGAGRAVRSWR